jgi:TonB family protein
LFDSLITSQEHERRRRQSLAASFILQTSITVLAVTITIAIPSAIKDISYAHMTLVAPPIEQPEPYKPPRPKVKLIPVETPKIQEVAKVDFPKIIVPATIIKKVKVDDVAPVKVQPTKFDAPMLNTAAGAGPKLAKQVVATNFGSSATPTLPLNTPVAKVQTGGFGDPNGVKPNPNAPAKTRLGIAAVGSFDLPAGPGQGNGSGGANGKAGTVASAGFGNGIAVQTGGNGRGDGRGQIQTTGFSAAAPVAEVPQHRKTFEEIAATTPVSITSKPSPQYTDEARRLKVEGEVLVKVVFSASGEVRVLNVVRGLGHGLDESAIKAAQNVRFNPALRNGQPVDSTATLHIVFQLS